MTKSLGEPLSSIFLRLLSILVKVECFKSLTYLIPALLHSLYILWVNGCPTLIVIPNEITKTANHSSDIFTLIEFYLLLGQIENLTESLLHLLIELADDMSLDFK